MRTDDSIAGSCPGRVGCPTFQGFGGPGMGQGPCVTAYLGLVVLWACGARGQAGWKGLPK